MSRRTLPFIVFCLLIPTRITLSQCDEIKVDGPLGVGAGFGTSISANPSSMAVGSPALDQVVIYRNVSGTWTQEVILTGPTGSDFGRSVAINGPFGSQVVVGAPKASPGGVTEAGEVHFIERQFTGTWVTQAILTAPTPTANVHFGAAVDYDTSLEFTKQVVVGQPGANSNSGSVLIFWDQGSGLFLSHEVTPPLMEGSEPRFGAAVGLLGQRLLIGSPGGDLFGISNGGACHFYWFDGFGSNWVWRSFSWGTVTNTRFGTAVAIAENFGAASGIDRLVVVRWIGGAVTVAAPIIPEVKGTGFGSSLAMSGDLLAVGAPMWPGNSTGHPSPNSVPITGAVQLFQRAPVGGPGDYETVNGASYPQPWVHSLSNQVEGYGASIAMIENKLMVGAPGASTSEIDAGAVYDMDASVLGWNVESACPETPTAGLNHFVFGAITPGETIELRLESNLASAPTFLVVGLSEVNIPFLDTTLYASPDIIVPGILTDSAGNFAFQADLSPGLPMPFSFVTQFFVSDASAQSGWVGTCGMIAHVK